MYLFRLSKICKEIRECRRDKETNKVNANKTYNQKDNFYKAQYALTPRTVIIKYVRAHI